MRKYGLGSRCSAPSTMNAAPSRGTCASSTGLADDLDILEREIAQMAIDDQARPANRPTVASAFLSVRTLPGVLPVPSRYLPTQQIELRHRLGHRVRSGGGRLDVSETLE